MVGNLGCDSLDEADDCLPRGDLVCIAMPAGSFSAWLYIDVRRARRASSDRCL